MPLIKGEPLNVPDAFDWLEKAITNIEDLASASRFVLNQLRSQLTVDSQQDIDALRSGRACVLPYPPPKEVKVARNHGPFSGHGDNPTR